MLGLMLDVLVEIVNRTEVAKVPVKASTSPSRADGNGWHYNVPAIPGIAGNGKSPDGRGRMPGCRQGFAKGLHRSQPMLLCDRARGQPGKTSTTYTQPN